MRKGIWTTLAAAATLAVAGLAQGAIVINEIDSDSVNTPSTDHAEFIELYSTTGTTTALDGLVIVLFNGNGDVAYAALDLDGQSTNASGYYLIGSNSIPGAHNYSLLGVGNILQNGADAVALITGDATSYANGTLVTTIPSGALVDAIVYDTADADDTGLLTALGQATQYDEFSGPIGGSAGGAVESLARLPNGSGGFVAQAPTPGITNLIPEPASVGMVGFVGALAAARRRRA